MRSVSAALRIEMLPEFEVKLPEAPERFEPEITRFWFEVKVRLPVTSMLLAMFEVLS